MASDGSVMASAPVRSLATEPPDGAEALTVMLDYTAYPHIFDAILAAAPRAALLQLRATCSELSARVDRQLARHIHILEPSAVGAITNLPLYDGIPHEEHQAHVEVVDAEGRRHPLWAGWAASVKAKQRADADSMAALHRCLSVVALAHVVDLSVVPRWVPELAQQASLWSAVALVRYPSAWVGFHVPTQAPTAVFSPLLLGRGSEWVFPIPFHRCHSPKLTLNVLPPIDALTFPPTADSLQMTAPRAEVVINFAGLAGLTQDKLPPEHLGLLFPVARVVFNNPTTTFTLVGVETVDPVVFGVVWRSSWPAAQDEVRRHLQNVVDRLRSWYEKGTESILERIRVMTVSEYREAVGEEMWELETM